ncbi:MAG TPA: fumarate hydratase, partial [Clostridiales bacterium]|nr:fumarate hydratase [Clostridiales bacterium]
SPVAQSVLSEIEDNLHCAKENQMPICQDTGMAVVFIRLGMDIHIESSKSLLDIVNLGVAS